MSIPLIQQYLAEEKLEGWLLYDFRHCNDLMWQVLKIPDNSHMTRRAFYWIPREGFPLKIVHAIESHVLDFLEGGTVVYKTREEIIKLLSKNIKGPIAMEVSKEIPTISKIDAGTYALVTELGIEVVSSGKILQKLTSVLTEEQIESHLKAAQVLSMCADKAFDFVRGELLHGSQIYETDVQEFILNYFTDSGCVTDYPPIVAAGTNSAIPHYEPKKQGAEIKKGDFLLIDLWCKKREKGSVYADITRVAATANPSPKMVKVFHLVREAQKKAVAMIEEHKGGKGCDVDQMVREFLKKEGFEENILHRLGHNITTELHGNGANLDSFETYDERELIDRTCYSIEPALYFPGEFGIRLEHDILFDQGKIRVTGGVQEELFVLF